MLETKKCHQCGAILSDDSPAGQCVACLLRLGLAAPASDPQKSSSDTPVISQAQAEEDIPRVPNYRVLQKIGEGGGGVVYLAEQLQPLRRQVAFKVIKVGMDTRQVTTRFETERQTLALMDHPSIAKVFDAGAAEDGRPYFAMELVRGQRITDYCDQHKLDTRQRLLLLVQVCQAVQHAHQKGIIHRDIKPSNILIADQDGTAVPKIIDFGIAKATSAPALADQTFFTSLQQFVGTPAYMSPEQAGLGDQDIDTRSDIYSLGVLLYEILTGRPPFEPDELCRSALAEMLRIICKEPSKPSARLMTLTEQQLSTTAENRSLKPSKLRHLLQGDLDWIVMRALEKDRSRRYETANGLAQDLQRYLDNEPVAARPPSEFYRLQKLAHRHKFTFAAVTAVMVSLLFGFGVSTWLFLKERAVESEKDSSRREARVAREQAEQNAQMEQNAQKWLSQTENENTRLRKDAESARSYAEYKADQERRARQRVDAAELELTHLRQDAESRAYAEDMNATQDAIQTGQFKAARQILRRYIPTTRQKDLRGWEWRYLWETAQSGEIATTQKFGAAVAMVTFSNDGQVIVACDVDGTARMWDVSARTCVAILTNISPIRWLAFEPNDKALVVAAENGVSLWQLNPERLVRKIPQSADAKRICFSPDGKLLVALCGNALHVWDAKTFGNLQSIRHSLFKPEAAKTSDIPLPSNTPSTECVPARAGCPGGLAVMRDGRIFAAGNVGGAEIYTGFSGSNIAYHWLSGKDESFVFSPNSEFLLVTQNTGEIVFADPDNPDNRRNQVAVNCRRTVAFAPQGDLAGSGSSDYSLRLWSTDNWAPVAVLKGHEEVVTALAFSPDGKRIVSGSKDGQLKLWPRPVSDLVQPPSGLKIVPNGRDGHFLAACANPRSLRILAAPAMKDVVEFSVPFALYSGAPPAWRVTAVAFAPNAALCALVDAKNRAELDVLSTADSSVIGRLTGKAEWVSAKFSDDGQRLLGLGSAFWATWAITNWSCPTEIGQMTNSVQFASDSRTSADLRWISCGLSQSRLIQVSGLPSLMPIAGSGARLADVSFSPNNKIVASTRLNGFVYLQRLGEAEAFTVVRGGVYKGRAEFAPNGARLLTWNGGIIRLWNTVTFQQVLELRPEAPASEAWFADNDTIVVTLIRSSGSLKEIGTTDTAFLRYYAPPLPDLKDVPPNQP